MKCACVAESQAEIADSGSLEWHTNYAAAYAKAKRDGRMLRVNFVPSGDNAAQRQLESAPVAVDGVGALAARLQVRGSRL
jgi:hypothetical protein